MEARIARKEDGRRRAGGFLVVCVTLLGLVVSGRMRGAGAAERWLGREYEPQYGDNVITYLRKDNSDCPHSIHS